MPAASAVLRGALQTQFFASSKYPTTALCDIFARWWKASLQDVSWLEEFLDLATGLNALRRQRCHLYQNLAQLNYGLKSRAAFDNPQADLFTRERSLALRLHLQFSAMESAPN
ncbi:MAG: hypothetical protein Udaeo2_30460 [Candidatus Udaeobacter sp.]|nr:MAG: hypothetical protein Udaeo2_30460 [Candidatus Udaeobacter sp.]